jgi:threonine/homoserine/homoserine lactone efflux protein
LGRCSWWPTVPDFAILIAFAEVSLALVATPGAGMLYVNARSLDGGRRAGLASMLGIQSAEVVYIALAAAGPSAVLTASPAALSLLKYARAAIVIAIGIRQWLRGAAPPAEQGASVRWLFAHDPETRR